MAFATVTALFLCLPTAGLPEAPAPSTAGGGGVVRERAISLPWMADGWRFRQGDDFRWADPGWDDEAWPVVRPDEVPGYEPGEGPAWFRNTFQVQPGTDRHLLLEYQVVGALEVYVDGRREVRVGRLGDCGSIEHCAAAVAADMAPLLHLTPGEHTIAVRVANPAPAAHLHLLQPEGDWPFRVRIVTSEIASWIENHRQAGLHLLYFVFGLTLAIGVYQLIIWRTTRFSTRVDLLYGGFSLALALRAWLLAQMGGVLGRFSYPVVLLLGEVVEAAIIVLVTMLALEMVSAGKRLRIALLLGIWAGLQALYFLTGLSLLPLTFAASILIVGQVSLQAFQARWPGGRQAVELFATLVVVLGIMILSETVFDFGNRLQLEAFFIVALLLPYGLLGMRTAVRHASNQLRLREELRNNEWLRMEAVQRERELAQRAVEAAKLEARVQQERLLATQRTAAGIAHEFNSPLGAVKLSAELLQNRRGEHEDPEFVARLTRRIVTSTDHMARMIEKLLKLSDAQFKGYVGEARILDLSASSPRAKEEEQQREGGRPSRGAVDGAAGAARRGELPLEDESR